MQLDVLRLSILVLASLVLAKEVQVDSSKVTAYGYLQNYGIPKAEQILRAEETRDSSRIVGGLPAVAGQYPSQAGLIGDIIGIDRSFVCGASLVSTTRALTAAHCWNDGVNQVWRLTVVLGSDRLFSGGIRVETSVVAMHPDWNPRLVRNDIAVIYLSQPVPLSSTIFPVALPSRSQIFENVVGEGGIAVGFGISSNDGSIDAQQSLNHVRLNVITNDACSIAFPFIVQPSHICTSGRAGMGICSGDSGGPLLVSRDGNSTLVGIASFGSTLGCESGLPSVFTRVTSFLDFILFHVGN